MTKGLHPIAPDQHRETVRPKVAAVDVDASRTVDRRARRRARIEPQLDIEAGITACARVSRLIVVAVMYVSSSLAWAAGPSSTNYAIPSSTMNAGAAQMGSGKFTLSSSLGDPYFATPIASTNFQIAPGFWQPGLGPGAVTTPTAVTGAASAILATAATLNGFVSSNGALTTVSFQIGLTAGYGSVIAATQSPLGPAVNGPVSAHATGLVCATTYHFRAVAVNFVGLASGADATFTTPACALLNVTRAGSGTGAVASNPAGIACGSACSASFASVSDVQLLATPAAGAAFTGWSDACSGTGPCVVSMTVPRSVTASFASLFAGSAYANEWVQKAYVAYYGRPADPAGLSYWALRMDNEGGSLESIIAAFGNSDEFNRRYGGLGNTALVTKIYQQTLGRDPEPAGLAYYVGELDTGKRTLQSITLDVLNGATGLDALTVANRLDVANHYSGKVAVGCAYGGELTGVNSLAPVTSESATVWTAKLGIESRCTP